MKLREYLDQEGLIIQDLANAMNTSWTYAWRVIKGLSNPSAMVALQIEKWTKGKVKVYEIRKCTKHCGNNCDCSKRDK